jgi:anti-sigma regulatory factor (Ser/Thr protein kinase)
MHGKTSTAGQASAGGHARHAGTSQWAPAPVAQDDRPASRVRKAARILPPADAQGNDFGDRWPLHSFLELGALSGAVPCARLHVREMLWEWRLTGLTDDAELIVSELVTNAVQISRAEAAPVRLWLLSDGVCVLIVVWDASLLPPVRMASGETDESGRGLLLVETLSARWAWYFPPGPHGGKVVWSLIEALLHVVLLPVPGDVLACAVCCCLYR